MGLAVGWLPIVTIFECTSSSLPGRLLHVTEEQSVWQSRFGSVPAVVGQLTSARQSQVCEITRNNPAVLIPHLALFHPNHGREKSVLSSSTSAHDVPRMVSNDPASTIIIAETSMFFNIIRPTFLWNVLRWVTLTSGLGHECEYAALIFYHRGVVIGLAFQYELTCKYF
jgi:hypothetical protein